MVYRQKNLLRNDKGFTLLEVMVAITILLLVILPLAGLFVRSLTVIQNAALYSQAIQLAQERVEVCQAVGYPGLYYYNEAFTPGFPYTGPLPVDPMYDGATPRDTMEPVSGNAYDCRDNPDTPETELYFDPTDSLDRHYPVPVYRDYYNNYTGVLLDPNFNGLCDDDLDGDGGAGILADPVDMDDIEIATNGTQRMYSDSEFGGLPASALGDTWVPGDGLYDTVVEGTYVTSMDQMYRMIRITESPTPILDMGLLMDQSHRAAVADYRYREATYQSFVRMTTFIDPTPELANPNDPDTWADQLYERDNSYTAIESAKLHLCLQRDLPLDGGFSNFDVGVADGGLIDLTQYNLSYATPIYGIRIIVTVFYLTGQGEMQLTDVNADGVAEEVSVESYGGARRVRLERYFYSHVELTGISVEYAPPRRFKPSDEGTDPSNPVRSVLIPDVVDGGDGSDPCDFLHKGLPYLD